MKRFLLLSFSSIVLFASNVYPQTVGDFQSRQDGDWDDSDSWEEFVSGSPDFWNNTGNTPDDTDGLITILAFHTITVPSATTINANEITVQGDGVLDVDGTLVLIDGSGDELLVEQADFIITFSDGKLNINNGGEVENRGQINTGQSGFEVFSSGTYEHNQNGGTVPTVTWDSGSTCLITGITSTVPAGLNQSFHHFTWDCTGQTAQPAWLNGNLTDVNGNLTIEHTNGRYFALSLGQTGTTTVDGNLSVNNDSQFYINATGTWTLNVGGNFSVSSTRTTYAVLLAATGSTTVNVTGSFSNTSTGVINLAGNSGTGTLNVDGNFTFSNGTITETSSGTANVNFSGTSTQAFTGGGTFANTINFTIENGATLNLGTGVLSGAGTFDLDAGGTLGVGSTDGLDQGTTIGNIRVLGTRTYTANGNVVYNGSSAQDLGDEWDTDGGLNGVAVNLEIDNASGVTNNIIGTTSVVGILTLTNGPLNIGNTNTFDIKGNFVGSGGTIQGTGTTSNLTFSGTGTFTGTLGIASPFDLNNLTINRSATIVLGTDIDINGVLSFASTGDFDISGQTLTIEGNNGDITQTGSGGLVSTPTTTNLVLNGTEGLTALPFCTTCGTMNLNDVTFGRTGTSPAYTWNSAVSVNGDVFLNSGILTHTSGLNMATGSTFNRGASGSISAAPTATTTYNVAYSGTLTTGPELPTVASGDLNNLTVAGDATLDKPIDINGNVTINSGTLAAGSNAVTLSGSSFTVNAGTFTINSGTTFTFDNVGTTTMSGAAIGGTQFGNLTIASGTTLSAPNANINVSGIWTNNDTFTANSGTVTFNGTAQSINPAGQAFNNVVFANSGTKTLQGTLDAANLTIDPTVTLDVGAGNESILVSGSWTNNGTFTANAGTVTFDGSGTQTINSGDPFFNLTLATSSSTKDLGAAIDVDGVLTINSGVTFDAVSTFNTNLAGNLVNEGTIAPQNSGYTFDGTTTISGSGTTEFHDLTIAGTLNFPSSNIDVSGTWLYSSGTFTASTGTVTFDGATENVTSGAQPFNNVVIAGAGTKTLQDALDINGNLTLNASTLDVSGSNYAVTIDGNWDASGGGSFNPQSGQVIFNGTTQSLTSSGESFNNVQIASTSTTTVTDAADINGILNLDGTLNLSSSIDLEGNLDLDGTLTGGAQSINIAGNWDATNGSFTTTGLTTFDGATQSITSDGSSFGSLTIAGTMIKTLSDVLGVNSNLIITSTLDVSASDFGMTIGGNWTSSSGTFTAQNGLVTLAGAAQNVDLGVSNTFYDLTVAGSDTKTLTSTLDIDNDITISSTLASGSNDINLAGDWTNNGTYTRGTETVFFDGSGTEQTIGGTSTTGFNNMDVRNGTGGGVQLSATATVELFGEFDFNGADALFDPDGGTAGSDGGGNFIVKSTSDATSGYLANLSDESSTPTNFNGLITVERFTGDATANTSYWRYITPVSTATVADWQDDFPITGTFANNDNGKVTGADNPSLYDYVTANATPTLDDGWRAYPPTTNTEALTAGVGYVAYIRGDHVDTQDVIDIEGTANVGNFTFTISDANAGWNLIGNPYASPIDWEQVHGNGFTSNVNGTMSVKDNEGGGGFVTWNAATMMGTGSQYIAMGQAFWVQATGASPQLRAEENDKHTSGTFVMEEGPIDYIRITLTDGVLSDQTLIHFNPNATEDFDIYDGNKLMNDYFNLSSNFGTQDHMVINTIGSLDCQSSFELNIDDVDPGSYMLEFAEFESFVDPVTITLIDNFTNTSVDVSTSTTYAFEVTADTNSFGTGRFEITFDGTEVDTNIAFTSDTDRCIGENATVTIGSSQEGIEYQAFIDGNSVSDVIIGNNLSIDLILDTDSFTEGDYVVEVRASEPGCMSLALNEEQPLSLIAIPDNATVTDSNTCIGQSATLTAVGAPADGSYNWYQTLESVDPISGENTEILTIDNLQEVTTYYVSTVNSLGCESIERVAVTASLNSTTEVESVTNDTVCAGDAATIIAAGAPVDGFYNWYLNPSDTDPIPNSIGEEYMFSELLETTTLYVTVVNATGCESSERVAVTAEAIPVLEITNTINGSGCSGTALVLTAAGAPEDGSYKWYESVMATEPIAGETGSTLTTPVLEVSGSYFVTAVNSQGCESLQREEVHAFVEPVYLVDEVTSEVGCPGSSVTLTAAGAPVDGSYRWYDTSGTLIDGESGATYSTPVLEEPTEYFVSVVNSADCESEQVSITATISTEALTIQGEGAFICGTGDITLVASGAPEGGSYQWYDSDGNVIEGATSSEFVAAGISATTSFSVQSISITGCTSELLAIAAEVREAVPVPVIEKENDIIRSSITGDTYQWFKDGVAIEGENGSALLTGYDAGSYTVEVFRNGCSKESVPLIVLSIFEDLDSGDLDLYPNPTSDIIRLEFEDVESAKVTIYVLDMSGRILHSDVLNNNAGRVDWELSMKEYENGVYFVKLADGMKVLTGRFVKK